VATKAFCNGGELDDGDSAAIAAPSIVAEFKGDIDGGDNVLIDAHSPLDTLRAGSLSRSFDKPNLFLNGETTTNAVPLTG
jgi:hypothetical protein